MRESSNATSCFRNIYKNQQRSTLRALHITSNDIIKLDKINKGKAIRQGDTISPNLFTLALDGLFTGRKAGTYFSITPVDNDPALTKGTLKLKCQ